MHSRNIIAALVLVLALALGGVTATAEDAIYGQLGEAVPDFTVSTIDGGTFTLSEALAEKDLVLINLWATWCGPCEMEFPYLEEAYEQYEDQVAVIALSVEADDSVEVLTEYAESHGLTFPIGSDTGIGLGDIYATEGIPTSVFVDRFGNAGMIEIGSQPSTSAFTRVFDYFLSDLYTETAPLMEAPPALPTVDYVDEAELSAALNVEGGAIAFTNPEEEYTWPMIPAEKDGRTVLVPSNVGENETTASVFANVTAKEGDALAFDFATSTEGAADLLYVTVDGETAKVFGGEHDWTTWLIALEPGEHHIGLSYSKDYYDEAGLDIIWLDNVRLANGDEAEAIRAAMPVYPIADEFAIVPVDGEAKEIVFEGDEDDMLFEYFYCDSYWIVPEQVVANATLTADIDPEAAFSYSNYDGSQFAMSGQLNAEGTAYTISSYVDSLDTTGYSYSNLYVYRDVEGMDPSGVCGIMLFPDEENVNAFIEEMAGEGLEGLSWHYADGTLPATDAVAASDADDGMREYTAIFVDQDGAPVPGCIINFCTDETCVPAVADKNGVAVFSGPAYPYHLQVIKVPEGYAFDTTQEFYAEDDGGEMTFVVEKQ